MGRLVLKSQTLREVGPEIDSLRLGMGWSREDLSKPQILVESVYGYGNAGSYHLERLGKIVERGVNEGGGKASLLYASDICDGIAQGHEGMNYSLPSRDFMAGMVEIHAKAEGFDGLITISSCDKAIPAHLMAIARLDLPALHLPGGSMLPGPGMLTLEQVGTYYSLWKRGAISKVTFKAKQRAACPTCGACAFMGTASTMQILGEALGLALPNSALIPVTSPALKAVARRVGGEVLRLVEEDLRPSKILSREAFENAIIVHSAIGGSTNALLHLPAIAREVGLTIPLDLFDELQRDIPLIVDIRPSGKHPATFLWPSGGAYEVMRRVKDHLNLDVMTVTGKTLGENMRELEKNGFLEKPPNILRKYGLRRGDIIHPVEDPVKRMGAIAVLKGNIAPEGGVVKQTAVDPAMFTCRGEASVFDSEEAALKAVQSGEVDEGVVVVRYEGPKGSGMPEMFYLTEAIASDEKLSRSTALITDGRFSGASRGPCIGHISPEAAEGGPIAVLEDGDIIEIDIPARRLALVGVKGKDLTPEGAGALIKERLASWKNPQRGERRGVLGIFTTLAASGAKGGSMLS